MRRRIRSRGKAVKKPQRKRAPLSQARSSSLPLDPSKRIETLERELVEAREQQTATAEVLKIISSSPGQVDPVFDAMLANAVRICAASFGVLFRYEDEAWRAAAMFGVPVKFAEYWQRGPQRPGPANRARPPRCDQADGAHR